MSEVSEIRPSPIAGTWYSGDAVTLASQVDAYLANAKPPKIDGEIVALVAPHAGHRYSGRTAGYAFCSVQGRHYDLVVIVSPFHGIHPAAVLTTAHGAYATPLGTVPVDRPALADLAKATCETPGLNLVSLAYDSEHSLEIELPFLQRALTGETRLLPVMLRTNDPALVEPLGHAIARVVQYRSALLVASSDLSHFYPEGDAEKLDGEMLRQVSLFSPEGVLKAEAGGTGFACGAGALAAILWAARDLGADSASVVHHSTSADETGDRRSVVGYGAAVLYKKS